MIETFTDHRPSAYVVASPIVDLFGNNPPKDVSVDRIDSQLLFGERVRAILDAPAHQEYICVENCDDNYIGYVAKHSLMLNHDMPVPTHMVINPQSPVFGSTSIKDRPLMILSAGSKLYVHAHDGAMARIAIDKVQCGWIPTKHLASLQELPNDFVTNAKLFLGVPYIWGGRSGAGLDCSALIQMGLRLSGHDAMRDSHQLQSTLGEPLPALVDGLNAGNCGGLIRGDLIFWPAHCGIYCDAGLLLHANAGSMNVAIKPLGDEVARIAQAEGLSVCAIKRLSTYRA